MSCDSPRLFGNESAARMVGPVMRSAVEIHSAPRKLPKLCVCCPRPVRGRVVVIIMPYRDDPTAAIGAGLCARCAALPEEVLGVRVRDAVRQFWPNARMLSPVSEAPEGVQ